MSKVYYNCYNLTIVHSVQLIFQFCMSIFFYYCYTYININEKRINKNVFSNSVFQSFFKNYLFKILKASEDDIGTNKLWIFRPVRIDTPQTKRKTPVQGFKVIFLSSKYFWEHFLETLPLRDFFVNWLEKMFVL